MESTLFDNDWQFNTIHFSISVSITFIFEQGEFMSFLKPTFVFCFHFYGLQPKPLDIQDY